MITPEPYWACTVSLLPLDGWRIVRHRRAKFTAAPKSVKPFVLTEDIDATKVPLLFERPAAKAAPG